MNIDLNTLSTHLVKVGINPMNVARHGNIVFSTEQLMYFSASLVEACAKVQTDRSSRRHGYDKYDDGGAIFQYFEIQNIAKNGSPR